MKVLVFSKLASFKHTSFQKYFLMVDQNFKQFSFVAKNLQNSHFSEQISMTASKLGQNIAAEVHQPLPRVKVPESQTLIQLMSIIVFLAMILEYMSTSGSIII